ncbi:MAG TPA: GDP-mannose 4,6-dehydratase [Solirubrobacterales bacterium]|jgi:GDP-4-dehydro-6-deoxy-D-mannose reductase|nr:GDP-mannose 4,6-dehydratase [Solirubrobacterales bacterium]
MNDRDRTAFITGVSSFAGRRLAEQLVQAGWRVEGTVLSRASGVAGVTEHKLEIDDRDAIAELLGPLAPTVVFHLAAIVDTVTTPDVMELHRINTMGTVAVTEAMRVAAPSARLVFTSSAFAYGRTPAESQPVTEDEPLRPLTPYGASKVASEQIVSQFARETGADVVITRAFQHTGPEHTGAYALADWAGQLARIERDGGPGSIATGNLEVERDYLDVRDVASAYVATAERGKSGAVYNVSSGVPLSMRALLEGLIEAFGVDATIETDPARVRAIDQPVFVGDPTRLKQDTGWEPAFSLDETLRALADFARTQL